MSEPDFDRVFAESGNKDTISDSDYDSGWAGLTPGDIPPTIGQFNSIMNEQSLKSKWLRENLPNENLLINGDFRPQCWQRGDNISGSGYAADRWWITNNVNMQIDISKPEGFSNSARLTSSSGAVPYMRQFKELPRAGSADVFPLGQVATISGWARSSTHAPNITFLSAWRDASASSANQVIDQAKSDIHTIQTVGDWEYFTHTFTIATQPVGTSVAYMVEIGSDVADEQIGFTGVKLELGEVATPFLPRPIAQELALCQRYYQIRDIFYTVRSESNVTLRWLSSFVGDMRDVPSSVLDMSTDTGGATSVQTITQRGCELQFTTGGVGTYTKRGTIALDSEL